MSPVAILSITADVDQPFGPGTTVSVLGDGRAIAGDFPNPAGPPGQILTNRPRDAMVDLGFYWSNIMTQADRDAWALASVLLVARDDEQLITNEGWLSFWSVQCAQVAFGGDPFALPPDPAATWAEYDITNQGLTTDGAYALLSFTRASGWAADQGSELDVYQIKPGKHEAPHWKNWTRYIGTLPASGNTPTPPTLPDPVALRLRWPVPTGSSAWLWYRARCNRFADVEDWSLLTIWATPQEYTRP